MIKNRLILFFAAILLTLNIKAQAPIAQLSEEAVFSLITCTPGDQVYNIFGHSAIRLRDPQLNLDFVYNYGTFDFETPGFVMKFVERKLLYALSKSHYRPFEHVYVVENRGVAEQKLNLDAAQKQRLYQYLENNYLPENREYLYDFFYDNCATRIRDVFEETFGKEAIIYPPYEKSDKRFRYYLDEYLGHDPWLNFGIDLILGLEADQPADFRNQMFLPDYLAANLGKASLSGKPLMEKMVWLLPKPEPPKSKARFFTPFALTFSLLLLVGVASLLFKEKRMLQNAIDIVLFLIFGLVGIFLLFMWFGTDHIATQYNLNTFWGNPLFLVLLFVNHRKRKVLWIFILRMAIFVFLGLSLLMFIMPIQKYNIAILPIVIMLGIRVGRRIFPFVQ